AAVPDAPPAPAAPPRRRRHLPLSWAAMLLLAALLAAGYTLIDSRRRDSHPPFRGPIPLTTVSGLSAFPAFSPDGERVAFSWIGPPKPNQSGRLHIFIQPVTGGEPLQVTSDATDDKLPQWSPDGSRIAVQRASPAGDDLVIVSLDGRPEQKVASMGVGLAWSPDGKEIAYVAPYPPAGTGGIRVHNLATGRGRDLTDPRPLAEGLLAWSPDGKQIAFARSLTQSAQDLFVVPSRGGPARRVTIDNQITEGFAWTSDSRELVFSSFRFGGSALWRVPAKGGTPERIAAAAHHPTYPALSPRANRLAFGESFGDSNIWQYERRLAPAGDAPFHSPRCLICSTLEDDSPRWSPDGRKILFVSKRTGSEDLWIADSDGGYPIQLTSLGTLGNGSPRWSPDGNWIAFDSRNAGNPDIYVISAHGGPPRRLTEDPSVDIEPSWSRGGKWVYFTSNRGGAYRVWKAPFGGGAAQQVTYGPGSAGEAIESADGKRLYFFRNDRHDGIWTVPVEGGAEEVVPELASVKPTRSWAVHPDGILFFEHAAGLTPVIRFFDFASHKITTVLTPDRPPGMTKPGLDLSPDGRRLLYTQVDQRIEGLMILENFH
ncbi:MAG: PD40 domain-containing protein, partial [Acidobacteriota bacterium]|nr:PD40 domain-containing protein [Acidobacteriota bacterium]